MQRSSIAAPLLLMCIITPLHSLITPSLYKCSALRITQRKGGRTYSKGFQVESLYIRFTSSDVTISGVHSKIIICRRLRIQRVVADTVFLEDPEEVTIRHSDLKLYLHGDTLKGNVNLFEHDTSDIEVKALVKKIHRIPEQTLERACD